MISQMAENTSLIQMRLEFILSIPDCKPISTIPNTKNLKFVDLQSLKSFTLKINNIMYLN